MCICLVLIRSYKWEKHIQQNSLLQMLKKFMVIDMITVLHDAIKNQFCEDNNIRLLRIPYWDKEKIPEKIEAFLKEIEGGTI